jgi:hypothetical protein
MNWRTDLENAHKDGRQNLFTDGKYVFIGVWVNTVHYDFPDHPPVFDWVVGYVWGSAMKMENATHWCEVNLP